MITQKSPKKPQKFVCEKCNYICSNKKDFKRHLTTIKHKKISNGNDKSSKIPSSYICKCGKKYFFSSGLSRHKTSCNYNNNYTENNITENKDDNSTLLKLISQNKELMNLLVIQNQEHKEETRELMKQNKEQSDMIKELIPKIGNNNNTINNQFNIQNFLNEDCKDALNFSEFINKIQVSFEDLENQAQIGFVKGISKLFIENLQELGTHKRPIHCTDKKRKTLYIKENDEWDKEGSQNILKKGIRDVSMKTMECLSQEKEENQEEYNDIESDFSQKYLLIKRNLLPGFPQDTTINKVIEQISNNSGIVE